ncbi:MAG TPA: hypothetical protein VF509_11410 [Sphingobium sp.]
MTAVALAADNRSAAILCDRHTQWSIAVGPIKIARATTQVRYIGPVNGAPSGARAAMIWGAAALVLAGWLSWGFAAQASAQRPRFITPIIDVVVPEQQRPASASVDGSVPLRPVVARRPRVAPVDAAMIAPVISDTRNFDKFPAVRRAVEAAFQTGEAQDWAEGPYQGLVVAGLAYPEGSKTCRDTAILMRDGGFDGMTKSIVTCRAAKADDQG